MEEGCEFVGRNMEVTRQTVRDDVEATGEMLGVDGRVRLHEDGGEVFGDGSVEGLVG